ncbi:MAG: prolipoprotein diacylglyceryl transferase [bacterium]|nr:prolipoprotein diacylglyceryl transferase [bacterium]
MFREILHINGFVLTSYGVMQALAFLGGLVVLYFMSKREKIDKDRLFDMAIWIIIGGVLGARVWFVIENFRYYSHDIPSVIKIWEGGMVFYGGLIGGFSAGIIYLKRNHLDIEQVGDITVPAFALGIFIGRIGCFLNGCCYGKVSHSCGVSFPKDSPAYFEQMSQGMIPHNATTSLPVIPTQLIESFSCLVIFAILLLMYNKRKFKGEIFYSFFVFYGLERFLLDYLRHYSREAMILKVFSLSQITSLILIIAGGAMLFSSYKRNRAKA